MPEIVIDRNDISDLIDLSLRGLKRMTDGRGLFCVERVTGDPAPKGTSIRYTLMCLLGLQTADENGFQIGLDVRMIEAAVLREIDSPTLKAGDIGLYLWMDARRGGSRTRDLLGRLKILLHRGGGYPGLEGMQLAWLVQGLALSVEANGSRDARQALDQVLHYILNRNRSRSGLFYHFGATGPRRRFPNFATEIYTILALTTVARLGWHDGALSAARTAADRLRSLQLADGGWPWLYDADRASVVEAYEVYSVHQHAMAPMAFLALWEVSGDKEYLDAAASGIPWLYGGNDLKVLMVDQGEQFIYRSVRRRSPWDRLFLLGNTGAALLFGRGVSRQARFLELNATCRPYELGWLLEAWAGRVAKLPDLRCSSMSR